MFQKDQLPSGDPGVAEPNAPGRSAADSRPSGVTAAGCAARSASELWRPRRVLVTPAALDWAHGRAMVERAAVLGSEIVELRTNRLTGLRDENPRREYTGAKTTMAVVVAPSSKLRLQPIPPSADWRGNFAEGCPAHCQYCYLAGSPSGPPVIRVYANLPEIP